MVLYVDKPLGVTSFDVIKDLKKQYPGQKVGHAGTLDPLASGLLICMVGKEYTKRQSEFMNLDKEYEFDVIFGFNTDSYDILGKVLDQKIYDPYEKIIKLKYIVNNYTGVKHQKVPIYSAVKVKGKPLYRHAIDKKIDNISIPVKEIEIKDIRILSSKIVSGRDLLNEILEYISLVKKGFRTEQIKSSWQENLSHGHRYLMVKFVAVVSKGAYVRALANDLGEILGVGGITMTIRRTKIGNTRL